MRNRWLRGPRVAVIATACAMSLPLASQSAPEAGQRWWNTVKVLADDNMEGRMTASAAYLRAADYVIDQFKKDGLQPAGTDGYFQPVHLNEERLIADESKLILEGPDGDVPLVVGRDLLLPPARPQPAKFEAKLVFVGYGLHIPAAGYDNFEGLNLNGKIVVLLDGTRGPANIPGPVFSAAQDPRALLSFLHTRGAVGMITIHNPKSKDSPPWAILATVLSRVPRMWLADEKFKDSLQPMLFAVMNPEKADSVLAGSGHTLQELRALAEANEPLPIFPLKFAVKGEIATKIAEVESPNLVGLLPGNDPGLKQEYVVFSAHLDHLGIGAPVNGDRIYNGAIDNASGVASVLEIARELHESGVKLGRSLLFLVPCGEEEGLLGSRYFVAYPTVPKDHMVADLNLDIVLPLYPLKRLVVLGDEESSLGPEMRTVAHAQGVPVIPDPHPEANSFIRSDQYSFIAAGIPSIKPKFGSDVDSPEDKMQMEWTRERYHHPSDDTNLAVDLVAAAKFNDIIREFLIKVANDPSRPTWNATSTFKPVAKQ